MTKITVERNLLEQWLEALGSLADDVKLVTDGTMAVSALKTYLGDANKAITGLKAALVEPTVDLVVEGRPATLAEIVSKARRDLEAVGGFDNGLVGVPASGVRLLIERLEAAMAEPQETAAERTLKRMGYTDCGGQFWKPPLGAPAQPQEPVATVVARHYIDGTYAGNALNWNGRNGEDDFPVGTKLYTAPAKRDLVPFGWVTVRWLSKKYKNHVDQYQFYPRGQSPYLDNVDQCYTVYLNPNPEESSAVEDPCRYPDCVDQGPAGGCVRWLLDSCSRGVVDE